MFFPYGNKPFWKSWQKAARKLRGQFALCAGTGADLCGDITLSFLKGLAWNQKNP